MLSPITGMTNNNYKVLDLFDGVVNVNASTGNISPQYSCYGSNSSYRQYPHVPTASNLLLSTIISTPISITPAVIQNIISPALPSTNPVTGFCAEEKLNFGTLNVNGTPQVINYPLTSLSYDTSHNFRFTDNNITYAPPIGFKGVACFSAYYDYKITQASYDGDVNSYIDRFGNQTNNYNDYESTNIVPIKIQVGGSASTICGSDPITGEIGSPFPNIWSDGFSGFNNLQYSFKLTGSNTTITGKIMQQANDTYGKFVPDPGQVIPSDAKTGLNQEMPELNDGSFPFQTNFSPAITLGVPVATATNPIAGQVGKSLFPTISLIGSNLPEGAVVTFTPAGSSKIITGKIMGGNFVPDASQVVPEDAKTGSARGILKFGVILALEVPTDFTTIVSSSGDPAKIVITVTNPILIRTGGSSDDSYLNLFSALFSFFGKIL
ncbi:MAG: hypothetical protein H7196_03610 [candidate division SR1 bacterium]|nr:hypothetical protein [candidate division SR1 bacterium]